MSEDRTEELIQELVRKVNRLERRVRQLEMAARASPYKGEQSGNFSTSELAYPGDYGTQDTDNEVQINIGGTVRAISTAAL